MFTLEGVTTVRVTVLVGCWAADAADRVVVVELVAAGRVMVGVAGVVEVASVLEELIGLSVTELVAGFSGTRLFVGWLLPLTGLSVLEGS